MFTCCCCYQSLVCFSTQARYRISESYRLNSGAGVYGESEFIFASIKVLTITGLIILGIVLDLGGMLFIETMQHRTLTPT